MYVCTGLKLFVWGYSKKFFDLGFGNMLPIFKYNKNNFKSLGLASSLRILLKLQFYWCSFKKFIPSMSYLWTFLRIQEPFLSKNHFHDVRYHTRGITHNKNHHHDNWSACVFGIPFLKLWFIDPSTCSPYSRWMKYMMLRSGMIGFADKGRWWSSSGVKVRIIWCCYFSI